MTKGAPIIKMMSGAVIIHDELHDTVDVDMHPNGKPHHSGRGAIRKNGRFAMAAPPRAVRRGSSLHTYVRTPSDGSAYTYLVTIRGRSGMSRN